MGKLRDNMGNDMIVPCIAHAIIVAKLEGREKEINYVKMLSEDFYQEQMRIAKHD